MNQQPLDIVLGTGDPMNRGLATMQNQLHISLPALADENLGLMQKRKYKKRTVSKHYVPPKIAVRNSELQRKRRELQTQRMQHQMPPRPAVEASRLKLSMPAVDQTIEHRLSLSAVREAEDLIKFQGSEGLGATLAKILRILLTGQILTSVEWFGYSGQEESEHIGSPCENCMYDGGMPPRKLCADSWNESEYPKKF